MTPPDPPAPHAARPAWRWFGGAAVLALGGVLAMVLLRGSREPHPPAVWELAPTRTLEARLSYPGAARYRPPGVLRSSHGLPLERLSPQTLEGMTAAGDSHGLAVGALLAGEYSRAAEAFQHTGASDDQESDRAALALTRGEWEEALTLLEGVLQRNPNHPQALWNRGLVLRELGLELTAASSFRQVAGLAEPGWSDEAGERARAALRQWEERKRRLEDARAEGWAWVEGQNPQDGHPGREVPGVARTFLYLALWSAPTAERVQALLPVARELDTLQGGEGLQHLVARLARHDFRQRGPFARSFAQLLRQEPPIGGEPVDWLRRLEDSRERDLLLGALPLLGLMPERLPEYEAAANALGDPWFAVKVELWHAERQLRASQSAEAGLALEAVLPECERRHLGARCLEVEVRRCEASLAQGRLTQARLQARRALTQARAASQLDLEQLLLSCLGRLRATAMDRAHEAEARARGLEFRPERVGAPGDL